MLSKTISFLLNCLGEISSSIPTHYPKNNLNLHIKTEHVTVRAVATVLYDYWLWCTYSICLISARIYAYVYKSRTSSIVYSRYQVFLNHRSKWSCCHPGCLALRVTSASPRNRRFAPLGFYWIPTYCLISVYHPVRAEDEFNHWLYSTWHRRGYEWSF